MSINNTQIQIRKVKGFTLMEALIGFLILSIGMLGIASLQAISLKSGKTSVYGSVAMMKVEELFESMRANPAGLASYTGAGTHNACTGSNNCTQAELAQDDMYWWKLNLKAGLPDTVTTAVTHTAAIAPSKMATVKIDINWKERDRDSIGSVDKTYTTITNICTGIPC
jgi:type IV pilus assembly protein PilV